MSLYGNIDSNSTGNGTMPLGIGQCAPGENTGDSNLWIVGVVITLIGTITSNGGTNVQKISVMREAAKPKIYQRPYVLQPLWCVGAAAGVVFLRARAKRLLPSPLPPHPPLSQAARAGGHHPRCDRRFWRPRVRRGVPAHTNRGVHDRGKHVRSGV